MTVEKQASSIFQAIYKGDVTIERAIQMMRAMKNNQANPREQQVFGSMVNMLFKVGELFLCDVLVVPLVLVVQLAPLEKAGIT